MKTATKHLHIILIGLSMILFASCHEEETYEPEIKIYRFGNTSGHKVKIEYPNITIDVPLHQFVDINSDDINTSSGWANLIFDDTLTIRHFVYEVIDSTQESFYGGPAHVARLYPPNHNVIICYFRPDYHEGNKAIREYVITPLDYQIAIQYHDSIPPTTNIKAL